MKFAPLAPLCLVLGLSVCGVVAVSASEEEVLVKYEFAEGATEPTLRAEGVEATAVVDVKTYIGASRQYENLYIGAPHSGDFGQAVDNSRYVEFTVGPGRGGSLGLVELRFDYGASSAGEGATGAPFMVRFQVRSSRDNFMAPLATTEPLVVDRRAPPTYTPGRARIELAAVQGFEAVRRPVTFRIYAVLDNALTAPTDRDFARLDNLEVRGVARR